MQRQPICIQFSTALLLHLSASIAISAPVTTIANFNQSSVGFSPSTSLSVDANGNIYGTTQHGNANGFGGVFQIDSTTHAFTTIVNFNGANGSNPSSGVIVTNNGDIYGTTSSGGSNNRGTIFKIDHSSHQLTTIYSFTGRDDGSNPNRLIEDSLGNIYGTTSAAGASGSGTIFKISEDTSQFTALHSLGSNDTIVSPLIADSTGNIYGVDRTGGSQGYGDIFKIAASDGSYQTLYSFTGNALTDGRWPAALTIDQSGTLYGISSAIGGAFQLSQTNNQFTMLASSADSFYPFSATAPGSLLRDVDGNLLSVSSAGWGAISELSPGSSSMVPIYKFTGKEDGGFPFPNLIMDGNGNLYGTTYLGGDLSTNSGNGYGTVFEIIASTHEFRVLGTFEQPNSFVNTWPGLTIVGNTLFGVATDTFNNSIAFSVSIVPEVNGLSMVGFAVFSLILLRLLVSRSKGRRSSFAT